MLSYKIMRFWRECKEGMLGGSCGYFVGKIGDKCLLTMRPIRVKAYSLKGAKRNNTIIFFYLYKCFLCHLIIMRMGLQDAKGRGASLFYEEQ